jgi:hypothetical protein
MRTTAVLPTGLALALFACTSDQSPTTPSSDMAPAEASAAATTYKAIDLGTLGGATSVATAINATGQLSGDSPNRCTAHGCLRAPPCWVNLPHTCLSILA